MALSDAGPDADILREHRALEAGERPVVLGSRHRHVALDDQEDGKALVKLVPPADLIRAREEKRAQAEAKMLKNQQQQQRQHAQRAAKLAKARIAPQDMFKPPHVPEGMYGSWDENGVPLTDGEGKVLSKNQGKRVAKEWAEQKKAHDGIK